MRVTLADAMARLPLPPTAKWPLGVWDVEVLRRGAVSLLLFAPKETDFQTPHEQDELYVVISGSGILAVEGEEQPFGPGDVLFVGARVAHRFSEFTPDFKAWVVFF
jgi:mannose-6-phosphate isomerase-like protein (cupin superfamily)